MKFPVISKGVAPDVGSISGYGEVNAPVQCGGVAVHPGDIAAPGAFGDAPSMHG